MAIAMTGGDPDVFDGMIGGNSPIDPVARYGTWMTQRQAWKMWSFFSTSLRENNVIAALCLQ